MLDLNQLIADCHPTPEPTIYFSGVEYLESFWSCGPSKGLFVRVDLGIREAYQQTTSIFQITDDFKRLKKNRINKPSIFKHNIGLIWGLEWLQDKSYHYHCLFIFDGTKVQNGVYYAHEIGCYWRDVITKGQGTFWNCNTDEDRYPESGIGLIDHRDVQKRYYLLTRVLPYLAKPDHQIRWAIEQDANALGRPDLASHVRTFGTSHDYQPREANVGRPRLYPTE